MTDRAFMSLALSLAKRRKGLTHPNPTVGCVVVKEGEVVGLGLHEAPGRPHAEVVALNQAGDGAEGSTLYVTLEPCAHHGRTPPCVEAILRAKVRRVVVAVEDPNPSVSGKGIERLRSEGVQVDVGVLREEARLLNEDFFTYITSDRPYVTLKLAQTLDGRIATLTGDSRWITSPESRRFAHKLRSEASAILVGINTVLKDDPLLTVRYLPVRKRILKVVIDPDLEIPEEANVLDKSGGDTLLVHTRRDPGKEEVLRKRGANLLFMETVDLRRLLRTLKEMGVMHLLVEGGGYTVTQFLREGLFDRVVLFQAPKILGEGIGIGDLGIERVEESLKLSLRREIRIGEERFFEYVPVMKKRTLRW
ncbi:MAG: bifunctional diaminohydroxyphosphoribosylaminopyrimidine deaminase/5-amino-6-(5-phosphoribosylamino)uracil reductase RibD [Aquificota bacterium]|nr:bifunctional diaminohydroxyphosphoribosylaminopyrimidine deaminase/5-amino-6-(5-phosphoribosylamino)uracil reductase RibD [Aquificota bacterium]